MATAAAPKVVAVEPGHADWPLPWLVQPLQQALQQTRGHALMIHGPSGIGQLDLALALAQTWVCEGKAATPGATACGHCTACHLFGQRSNPDVHILMPDAVRESLGWTGETDEASDGSKTKAKPSREIRVEAVRRAIDWARQSSSRGQAKVLLIYPAEAMNAVTANALLKTLEEPPGGLRVLLGVSDPDLLLPTIRSRCQALRLSIPPTDQALAWLQAQGVASPQTLLAAAGGRPLDAIALRSAGISAESWQGLPLAVSRGDASGLVQWPVPLAVASLQKLCHDALALRVGAEPRYFAAEHLPQGAQGTALLNWWKTLVRTARHDEHPWNAGLLVEALVAEGSQAWSGKSAQTPRARR